MSEPKPFASLGATLLARKGGAKPAMRPQLIAAAQVVPEYSHDFEDLGWNDMGEGDEARQSPAVALTPSPHPHEQARQQPEVRRQQQAIAEAIVADAASEPAKPKAKAEARRAAFTLRLDAQRHLKLRLASTIKNRSAQALVTEALDKFLSEIPEIDALAAQVKRK